MGGWPAVHPGKDHCHCGRQPPQGAGARNHAGAALPRGCTRCCCGGGREGGSCGASSSRCGSTSSRSCQGCPCGYSCPTWASEGMCTKPSFKLFMSHYCAASCGCSVATATAVTTELLQMPAVAGLQDEEEEEDRED